MFGFLVAPYFFVSTPRKWWHIQYWNSGWLEKSFETIKVSFSSNVYMRREELPNNKESKMPKFNVTYWERLSVSREIEAESDAEARRKMQEMVIKGEIDLSFAELDDSGIEAEKE